MGYYELDADLKLLKVDDAKLLASAKSNTAIPKNVLTLDSASVLTPTMPDVDGDCHVVMLRWKRILAGEQPGGARSGHGTRPVQRSRNFLRSCLPITPVGSPRSAPWPRTIGGFMISVLIEAFS